MFSLHETQRIYLCRAAFVLLCAVPTVGVLVWCTVVRGPVYRHWHERAIARQLQCTAKMTRASNPRPELLLFEGLDLSDRETGQLLARFPAVEIETTGSVQTIRLSLPGMINGRRLAELWQLAVAHLRDITDQGQLRFEAGHLTLSLSDGNQTLTDLVGRLDRQAAQSRLQLKFHRATADGQPTAPIELGLARHRTTAPHTTEVEATTGGTPLPCEVIAAIWPDARSLGRTCTFDGRLRASDASPGWIVELAGRWDGIDLDRLLTPFPHKLTGTARVDFEQMIVRDGRIEKAAGTFTAGPGTISRSLVQSAMNSLRLESSPRAFAGFENRLAYSQLSAEFLLAADGLSLKGRVDGEPGAVLVAGDQVLLKEPVDEKQPALNLVRTLVPQVAVQVPATRETDRLTRLLPVPPAAVPPGQERALPEARSLQLAPQKR